MRIVQGWGMTETSPLAALAHPPPERRPGEDDWTLRSTAGRVIVAASSSRIVDDAGGVTALGRRGGRRDRGARPVDHRVVLPRTPIRRSSTTAGCAPATSAGRPARLHQDHRPRQGRHQVGRRVDLVGRARELPAWRTPRCSRPRVIAVPDERWQERPLACVVRQGAVPAVTADELREFLGDKVARSGSSPSAGRSSTRCRRRASASSTRRCSGLDTPTASSMSSSAGTEAPRQLTPRWCADASASA